jgi:hypothetical protein
MFFYGIYVSNQYINIVSIDEVVHFIQFHSFLIFLELNRLQILKQSWKAVVIKHLVSDHSEWEMHQTDFSLISFMGILVLLIMLYYISLVTYSYAFLKSVNN